MLSFHELDMESSQNYDFKKSSLLSDIYQYYYYGGLKYIVVNNIVKLLISYILLFIINLLTNCIDYPRLLTNDEHNSNDDKLTDFIHMSRWFPSHPYLIICFVLYCIYLFCITLGTFQTINKFINIRQIYKNVLNITDNQLKYLTWDNIVNIILENDLSHNNNIYIINNKINKYNNVIISVFRSKLFTLPKISKLLEWNFIYCIIDPLINIIENDTNGTNKKIKNDLIFKDNQSSSVLSKSINENEIRKNLLTPENRQISYDNNSINFTYVNSFINDNNINDNTENYKHLYDNYIKTVNKKINLVIFINLISLPFAIMILGIYVILKYGEKFYHNPKLIYKRQISLKNKWQLRYYNELTNLYQERVNKKEHNMDTLLNQYHNSIYQVFYRLFTFILGSLFIILFTLTIIGGNSVANIIIFDNKTLFWFISVIGTVLIIMRSSSNNISINKKEQIQLIEKVKKDLMSLDIEFMNIDNTEYIVNIIKKIYPYKLQFILYEIFYLIFSIYYLFLWKKEINNNFKSLFSLIQYNYYIGNVSKYSIFNNVSNLKKNSHMVLSLKEFYQNHNFKFNLNMNNPNDDLNNFILTNIYNKEYSDYDINTNDKININL